MSKMGSDLSRKTTRRTLKHLAGGSPDSIAVADANHSTWRLMSAKLAPVIGSRGVDVLFRRSMHLTSTSFPWLAISLDHEGSATLLANLKAGLANRAANEAADASHALLVTFTKLLTTLIGESLTEQLLHPVWLPLAPASQQKCIR